MTDYSRRRLHGFAAVMLLAVSLPLQVHPANPSDGADNSLVMNENVAGVVESTEGSVSEGINLPFGNTYMLELDGGDYAVELDVHSLATGRIMKLEDGEFVDGYYPRVSQLAVNRGYARRTIDSATTTEGPDSLNTYENALTDTSGSNIAHRKKKGVNHKKVVVPYGDFYVTPELDGGEVYVIELVNGTATGRASELSNGNVSEVTLESVTAKIPKGSIPGTLADGVRSLAADDGICDCDVICTCYSRYLGIKWDVRAARQVGGTWIYGSWGRATRSINFGLREGTSGKGLCQCGFEAAPTNRELYGTTRIEAGPTLSLYKESYSSWRFDVSSTFKCNNG